MAGRSLFLAAASISLVALTASCSARRGGDTGVEARSSVTVGTVLAKSRPLSQRLTVSSELVPFQEIDVYAKEPGYVKQLYVDYGSKVKRGQLMAVLEIPELEAQLEQDRAAIRAQADEVVRAEHEIRR